MIENKYITKNQKKMTTPNNDLNNDDQNNNPTPTEKNQRVKKNLSSATISIITIVVALLICFCLYKWRNYAGTSIANNGGSTTEVVQDTTKPITATSDPVTPITTPISKPTTTNATTNATANLRSLPNETSAQVGQVKKGASIETIGISKDGLWIETPSGWISKNLLSNVAGGLPPSDRTHSAPAGWTKKEGGKDAPGVTSQYQSRGDQ